MVRVLCVVPPQVDANPEVREGATQEMMLLAHEMKAVLRSHRVSQPKMFACMLGQAPVFISLFLATREVSVSLGVHRLGFYIWFYGVDNLIG